MLFKRILKPLLSVLLVCLFCLPYSSLGFSASAETLADAVIIDGAYTSAYYYTSSGRIVTEQYRSASQTAAFAPNGATIKIPQPYSDTVNVSFLAIRFRFAEKKYFQGQTYNLSFTSNYPTNKQYTYAYFFSTDILESSSSGVSINELQSAVLGGEQVVYNFVSIGDYIGYPAQFGTEYNKRLSNAGISPLNSWVGRISATSPFSMDLNIPIDYDAGGEDPLDVYVCFLFYNDKNSSDFLLQDVKLTPIGATKSLYAEQEYQDEVIGSDEEGEESGIKGIFKKLTELPTRIGENLAALSSNIGNFFTQLKDNILQGIKDLFIPTDQQMQDFKNKMDLLLSDHLGVIYEAPNLMADFIGKLASFEPVRSDDKNDYFLEFPSKNLYINADSADSVNIISDSNNNGGEEIPLIPDNTGQGTYRISFGWLNDTPYSTFYSIYNAFMICVSVLAFCCYCIRKYNNIMEG